jgi:hypothetical protein
MLLYAQGGNINMDTKFPVQSASHNYAIYNGIFQTRIYALLRKHHLIPCLPYSIYSFSCSYLQDLSSPSFLFCFLNQPSFFSTPICRGSSNTDPGQDLSPNKLCSIAFKENMLHRFCMITKATHTISYYSDTG